MNSSVLRLVEESPDTTEIEIRSVTIVDQAQALEICGDEEYRQGSELLLAVKDLLKKIETDFEKSKKLAYGAWKSVVALEKGYQDPLLNAERIIKSKLSAFIQHRERVRREEQTRLQEIVRKREEEKRLAEAVYAEQAGMPEISKQILETPAFVPPVVVPGPEKIEGVHSKKVWKYQITDPAAIPREYLLVDEKAIAARVRTMGDRACIPGVSVYQDINISAGRR